MLSRAFHYEHHRVDADLSVKSVAFRVDRKKMSCLNYKKVKVLKHVIRLGTHQKSRRCQDTTTHPRARIAGVTKVNDDDEVSQRGYGGYGPFRLRRRRRRRVERSTLHHEVRAGQMSLLAVLPSGDRSIQCSIRANDKVVLRQWHSRTTLIVASTVLANDPNSNFGGHPIANRRQIFQVCKKQCAEKSLSLNRYHSITVPGHQ